MLKVTELESHKGTDLGGLSIGLTSAVSEAVGLGSSTYVFKSPLRFPCRPRLKDHCFQMKEGKEVRVLAFWMKKLEPYLERVIVNINERLRNIFAFCS